MSLHHPLLLTVTGAGIPGGDGKAPSVASPKAQGRSSILKAHVVGELGFIIAYFKIALCLPLVGVIGTVFHESIPKCFGSPSRAWHTIRYCLSIGQVLFERRGRRP